MQVVNAKNQCFVVWSNEIEGRIDAFYYKPELKELEKKISRLNHKRIKDISFDLKNGSTPSGGVFQKEGIPYFRSQDFNLFDFKINQFISEKFHKKLNRSAIKPKDVLLAVVGATLGVVGYVPENIKEGNINQNVVRIRVKNNGVNPKYLAIILASEIGQKSILRNATIQTQAYLNNSQLSNIKIPIPDKETQEKIVQLMESAYNQKHQKEQQANELLNSTDDYVLDELGIKIPEIKDKKCFIVNSEELENKRMDPKGYLNTPRNILKAIKKSKYKSKPLSDLIKISIAGKWGEDPLKIENKNKEGYVLLKVLRNTNFDNQGNLNFDEVAERLIDKSKSEKVRLQKGDILIEKSGGSPIQPVGRIALVENLEGNFGFSNFLQCLKTKKECLPEYLFCFLKALYSLNYMEYLQNQTTGIKNLIMEEYLSIPIPLPSMDIQMALASEFKNRLKQAEELKKEAKNIVENAKTEVEEIILGK